MPRRPRIKLAGIPQHIFQRGINREPCFFAAKDYYNYLLWLGKAATDWRRVIHAYVLMTNHVHLLVTPETEAGTAKLMQAFGRRYVQYINRSYRRTGSLWEGRYKSSLVQVETCLLACMRYIELNPVRAGMAQYPGQYRWSSYRHNGLGQADPRITPHPLYLAIDRDGTGRGDQQARGINPAIQKHKPILDSEQERINMALERKKQCEADPFDLEIDLRQKIMLTA